MNGLKTPPGQVLKIWKTHHTARRRQDMVVGVIQPADNCAFMSPCLADNYIFVFPSHYSLLLFLCPDARSSTRLFTTFFFFFFFFIFRQFLLNFKNLKNIFNNFKNYHFLFVTLLDAPEQPNASAFNGRWFLLFCLFPRPNLLVALEFDLKVFFIFRLVRCLADWRARLVRRWCNRGKLGTFFWCYTVQMLQKIF